MKATRKHKLYAALISLLLLAAVTMACACAATFLKSGSLLNSGGAAAFSTNSDEAEKWMAKYACSSEESLLRETLTEAFTAKLHEAQVLAREVVLPPFDPAEYRGESKPVIDSRGIRTAFKLSECTSLLGNLSEWAVEQSKRTAYLPNRGTIFLERPRVMQIKESFRESAPTSDGRTIYALHYAMEAHAGQSGYTRTGGDIMLLYYDPRY